MSVVDDPEDAHIQMTDGTGLDVTLNGERMTYRDGYEKATAVEAEYGDLATVPIPDWMPHVLDEVGLEGFDA